MINDTDYENDSFAFFGPLGMAFYDDGNAIEETYSVKLAISIVLSVSMVFGVVGNICTCAVIARDRSMRTPTNCYLFNLAITDLLSTFFIPLDIYLLWVPDFYPFGEEGCFLHFVLWDCLSNCNIFTISAFTVERYLVVSKPFLRQKLSLNSRVFKIVAIIWVVSCIFCIPDIFYIDLLERKKYVFCYITLSDNMRILVAVELFVFFVIPMTIIFVLYVLIALKLKSAHTKLRNSPVSGQQNRDKAVTMLAAVAATFFFCWFPYCGLRVMMSSPKYNYEDYYDVWRILHYLCSVNSYVSTVINPILYSLMSRKFRHAFKDFLKGRKSTSRCRADCSSNLTMFNSNTNGPRLTSTKLQF